MKRIKLRIKIKEGCRDLPLPSYATPGSSGMDLCADLECDSTLMPGERRLISCGFSMELPEGYDAETRPRSGLALKHGITLVNTPGTIDADYRGIVSLIVINLGDSPFTIRRGDRIAQMVIREIVRGDLAVSERLEETARSAGGFGHTGV